MKSIIKSIVAAAVLYAASATAAVLPTVGTGTEPNQWTRNMEGVLAAAQTTGLPILLVMINDSSAGDGCQHCMQFIRNTLNTDNFANIVASYKFYMVLLNKWPSESAYGNVSETYFRNYFLKYEMGDGGYPQVIIIKPDGKRYAGWSYETRPVSSSGPALYQYLSASLAEIAPTSSGWVPTAVAPAATVTTTETTSSSTQSGAVVSSTEVPKGKYALFFFNGYDDIVASAKLNVNAAGRWNAKITEGGLSRTLRGSVTKKSDGSLSTGSSDLNLVYDTGSGIWSGTSSGRKVYGKAVAKADSTWKGAWNLGISSTSSPTQGGWATATVGTSGRISFNGKISNTTKISGNSESAIFPESFVSTYLPRWSGHGNVRFGHGSTRAGMNVGCALCSDGTAIGNASYSSQAFETVGGSRWQKSSIAGLNGKTFSTIGGGYVSVPVTASGNRMAAGDNAYSARIRCTASKGQVAATYKANDKTYKASGVIYVSGYAPTASGGGRQRDEKFSFTIK